jgi:hypothetical protein
MYFAANKVMNSQKLTSETAQQSRLAGEMDELRAFVGHRLYFDQD